MKNSSTLRGGPALFCTGVAAVASGQGVALASSTYEKPNIILILADDMGYNDLGFRGSYIETPHLDSIATNGVIMNDFYTCPVSSPTRAGTLTGRYPIRMGMMRSALAPGHDFGIPSSEVLLPEMLAEAGYNHRAAFGKWHVGHLRHEWLPMQNGFTEYVGCYNGAVGYFKKLCDGEVDWHHGNESVSVDENEHVTDLIGDHAVDFINDVPKDEPYFLYLPFTAPHGPIQPKDKDKDKYYTDETIPETYGKLAPSQYAGLVDNLDQNIGKVVDAVRKRGDLDNTLIIFYSDNGGLKGNALRTSMKDGKFSAHEGGVRVVAFANWSNGGITGGRQVNTQTGYIDVYPTIKAAVYGDGYESVPDKNPLDGENILPVLQGKAVGEPRYWFSYIDQNLEEKLERMAVHYGDYKLYLQRPAQDNPKNVATKELLFRMNATHSNNTEADGSAIKDQEALKAELRKKLDEYYDLRLENRVDRYMVELPGFVAPPDWNVSEGGGDSGTDDDDIITPSENLVINGDFERTEAITGSVNVQPADWDLNRGTAPGNSIMAEPNHGYNGSRTLKLNMLNGATHDVSASQDIAVKPNTEYIFTCHAFYSKAVSNTKDASITITYGDGKTALVNLKVQKEKTSILNGYNEADNSDFIEKATQTAAFTVPDGVSEITLSFYSNGVDVLVRFDQVSIVEKAQVSLDNVSADMSVRVEDNRLVLSEKIESMMLFNITGTSMPIVMENHTVNIANLPRAVYIVCALTTDGDVVTHKFIK